MGAARRPDRSAGRFPFSRAFAEWLFCAAFANGFFVRCGKRAQRLHFGGESGIIKEGRYRGRYPLDGGAAAGGENASGSKPPLGETAAG